MAFSMMTPSIGIYLGTKYSCVGFWLQGNMEIIANDEGNTTTPSYVAFMPDRELIGEAAEIQADRNPTNTIFDINRLIGRRFSDPTVQSDRKLWPFNVIEGAGDKPKIVVQYRGEEKQFYPEELSAMILAKMKEIAEKFLHCSVKNAVIAVPAYFNDSQRFAIRGAGGIAGLNVLSIMDEPSAAALAYCFKLNNVFVWNVLVFDLSISTFDVSVVEYDGGVYTVKTTVGDMHLGGKDFDNRLLNYFLQQIKEEHKKDISDNPRSIRRLQSACEQAKKILSSAISTTVEVASLYEGIDFSSNITKDWFDEINMDLFERCMGLVTKCLEDARLEKTDIDLVVLLGGNTQIPKVQKMLQELFDGKELCKSLSLNAVVAYGATLQSVTLNVAPHVALKEIENANKERIALQHELSEAQKLIQQLMSQKDDDGKLLEVAQKLTEQQMSERDDGKRLSESAQKLIQELMYKRDDATKLSDTAQRLTELLISERDDARKLSEVTQKQLMSERDDARKLSKMTQKQLMRERDDARKRSEAAKKLTEQLKSERDDDKRLSEMAQKLTQQLISERDDAKKLSEVAQKLTEQLMSERDEATKLSEAAKKHIEQLMSERDDARKLSEVVQKQLMSERDNARKLSEMTHKQLMCERDDASKISEATQKLTEQLMSERDDAKKHLEAARKLTEQLMYERDDAKKHSEAAQKLTEQLMSERNDAIKHSEVAQKLTEQLMSEKDDAKKHSEAAHKLIEQLMFERDEAKKHSEAAQKLIEQLMSERDDEKKPSEEDQKLIEQLISERDNAIKQVEELHRLREQQAPAGSKSVGCFIEYSYSELQHATDNFHESVKLGEGGFGKVYKGILRNTTIAIKILNEESKQGAKAFHQEVEVLSKLEHPNLVKLIGACAEIHALIYEYLPNGSLEDRLQCKNNISPLSWQARVRIAFEVCSALSFLHCSKPHGIVHGDLKPDNVLLDLNNVSKLGDFGLCRQLNRTTNASQPFHITDCRKGTFGYIDPEYFTTGKMTPRNDVYSFGIMLLQLVTCKDPQGIRQSVEEAHRKGTLKALIDATAGPWPFKKAEKMISLGLRCSDIMSINRPDLSTVVLKEMKSMADVASASQSSTSWAASLFRR